MMKFIYKQLKLGVYYNDKYFRLRCITKYKILVRLEHLITR